MAIDTSTTRSRRALLAGGVGGLIALVAQAIWRPSQAQAGTDGDVVLGAGNTATTTTAISNFTTANTAFAANCSLGHALSGTSSGISPNAGVYGRNNATGSGVYGYSSAGCGVTGSSTSGTGVSGHSHSGSGVAGGSDSSAAIDGYSGSGWGVYGGSSSGIGVYGTSNSATKAATVGHSTGSGTGVFGHSGGVGPLAISPPAKTGVYGHATLDGESRGVWGRSGAGRGVYGQATSGVGTYGYATTGTGLLGTATSGYGLRTSGRVRIDRASGVATIEAGNTVETVTPGLDVTSASFVLLTPKADLGARRLWYTTNATANSFSIRVSSTLTTDVKVGWLLLG